MFPASQASPAPVARKTFTLMLEPLPPFALESSGKDGSMQNQFSLATV